MGDADLRGRVNANLASVGAPAYERDVDVRHLLWELSEGDGYEALRAAAHKGLRGMLEIHNLHATAGDKEILRGIDLTVNAGEVHERALVRLATERLRAIDGVCIYGPKPSDRSGVVSFSVAGIHPHDLSTVLDEDGVCIRAGQHCAQPLMRRLGVSATARASFYLYNDEADVEALVRGVQRAKEVFAGSELNEDELVPCRGAR